MRNESLPPSSGEKEPLGKIYKALEALVSKIPATDEVQSDDPRVRSRAIGRDAAMKAALISGSLALPPGPLGIATIIPDLIAIWKIQGQMVSDIAGAFGKSTGLRREQMIYCLFRHAVAQVARHLVTRVGGRVLVRESSVKVIQNLLLRVSYKVTQRGIGRAVSRWVPLVGAVGVGGYAFFDTTQVAKTAIELFAQPMLDGESSRDVVVVEAEIVDEQTKSKKGSQ